MNTVNKDNRNYGFVSYTSFNDLGGNFVPHAIVQKEVSQMPLDAILGYLSSLSIQFFEFPEKNKPNFFSPLRQGEYLNYAIVDDFPNKLPNAEKMYTPGRVPITQGRHRFIHTQNAAYLADFAIRSFDKPKKTYELDHELPRRVCRLLLIVNDLLNETYGEIHLDTLIQRRNFVLTWIRNWQFNKYQQWHEPWVELARENTIFLDLLPKYFDVEKYFKEASGGMSLKRYFIILTHWLAFIYAVMSPEKLWLNKESFLKNIKASEKEYFDKLISSWIVTAEQYRNNVDEWRAKRQKQLKSDQAIFDFVMLKETPLVEARPNEIVCPIIEFLIDKIKDGPFFLLSNLLKGQTLTQFHTALGNAYEEYANNLLRNIANKDLKGKWDIVLNPENSRKVELTDSLFRRGNIGISFEHKGNRLPTDFLLGGFDRNRIIGPDDEALRKIEGGKNIDVFEIKRHDEGFITEGLWQHSIHFNELLSLLSQKNGEDKFFFVLTFAARIRIDEICYKGYLAPLIDILGLYSRDKFHFPQWLHVSDLEILVFLANENHLDLFELMSEKNCKKNRYKRFDLFISEKFPGRLFYPAELRKKAMELMNDAKKDFFVQN